VDHLSNPFNPIRLSVYRKQTMTDEFSGNGNAQNPFNFFGIFHSIILPLIED